MPGNRQNGENSMNLKYFVGATLQLIIKVVVFAVIIMYIIRAAGAAYEYGYRVFAEAGRSVFISSLKILSWMWARHWKIRD